MLIEGEEKLNIVIHHTFFLLASAYSHGTQKSHYCLLATAHTSHIRICRIADLLRCKFVFSIRENHINTKGITEQKLNQPTGVNYLLTINHHYYYPKAAVDGGGSRTGFRNGDNYYYDLGIKRLELLVQLLQLDAGQCISNQHSAFIRAQGYYERLAANYISIVFGFLVFQRYR